MKENLISRAQEFARNAHSHIIATTVSGVKRPQIVHIQEVADLVWASSGTDEEVAAAWLHDSVEDTKVTLEDIEHEFGKEVAEVVHELTDPLDFKELPVTLRKQKQVERLQSESVSAKRIKIADQTSNVRFLAEDPIDSMTFEECGQYIQGAKLLADACRDVSSLLSGLFDKAYEQGSKRFLQ